MTTIWRGGILPYLLLRAACLPCLLVNNIELLRCDNGKICNAAVGPAGKRPWPSFVSDIKQEAAQRAANANNIEYQIPVDAPEDLLGVLELSYGYSEQLRQVAVS